MPEDNSEFANKKYLKQRQNSIILAVFFALLLSVLLICIAWVQIYQNEKLSLRSQQQQTRRLYVPAKRGRIYDRNALLLNHTLPMYSLVIRPDMLRDPRDTKRVTLEKTSTAISRLALYLGPEFYDSKPDIEEIKQHLSRRTAMPITLWQDLDAHTVARWNLHKQKFPGTELLLSWKRFYEYSENASQLRGYTRSGEPEDPDMKSYWNANFKEPVGKSGLEYLLNPRLRGSGGSELVRTDVLSFRNEVIYSSKSVDGEDIFLTIDIECQKYAEELYAAKSYRGATVVINAQNGEILVLASCPGFDLSARSFDTENQAQFNRATAGLYPPGSTIKPFYAMYAIHNELLLEDERFFCPGFYPLSSKTKISCHLRSGHGEIAVEDALAKSCNTFFCTLSNKIGKDSLNEIAELFVFGKKINTILYSQESLGIPYSPLWKSERKSRDRYWSEADSAFAGIGQGQWLVTPLQMAVSFSFLLTGKNFQAKLLLDEPSLLLQTYDWSEKAKEQVFSGMQKAVYAPGGTGAALRIAGVEVLGKTGTAEVAAAEPHSWAIAALPAREPLFIGISIVENGGSGGRVAAPLLKEVLENIWKKYGNAQELTY